MTSSITNWNLNEPDFTSPLDGSLDSIRANYHYLLMVAAHGSVVLPGWNTTVTATDYSEPDTITLTRGSQRIILNYTWTDGSVSAIQMCYDDGVSSPGLYCFPEIPFYYDDAGNPVGTQDPVLSPLKTGLVSWWMLDETSGTRYDSHGANHLTDTNTVTSAAGVNSNAALFNKANDEYLIVNSPTNLGGGVGDWTFACWVYLNSYNNLPVIANMAVGNSGSGGDNDYVILVDASGVLAFYINDLSGFQLLNGGTLSTGTWHHVICSYDISERKWYSYLDNGTEYEAGPHTFAANSAGTDFKLGKYHTTAPDRVMDGRIDDAAFWTRLLTADERAALASGITYTDIP